MKGWSTTPIKTINMSHDIFKDQLPPPVTNPPHLTRRLVDRKTSYMANRISMIDRYENKVKENLNEQQKSIQKTKTRQLAKNINTLNPQTPSKTDTQTKQRKQQYLSIDSKLKIYTKPSLKSNYYMTSRLQKSSKSRIKSVSRQLSAKPYQQQDTNKHHQQHEPSYVNPYTHQQYTYLKNQLNDHQKYANRNKKVKMFYQNHFMQSYRVNTISLSPQKNRSRPTVNVPVQIQRHSKTTNTFDPQTPQQIQRDALLVPPSPWQWGQGSYSIGKDSMQ